MEEPPAKMQKSHINAPTSFDVFDLTTICDWREPEAIAIEHHEIDENFVEITYEQLAAVQLYVSRMLINAKSSHFVGIASDIPVQCLPGLMLGIMSTGRAFVCLPAPPQETKRICDKLNVLHIFCHRDNNGLTVIQDFTVHGIRTFLTQAKEPSDDSLAFLSSTELCSKFAYAITTSGSTGEPKIVRVTHSSIVPNILDLRRILEVSKNDTIAQITPATFDPSIIEIFLSLSCNAKLLTVSQEVKNNPDTLLKILVNRKVSILQTTPSLLLHRWSHKSLRIHLLSKITHLRILLLGGEAFPNDEILSKIQTVDNPTKIYDVYGITEVSCWSSIRDIQLFGSVRMLSTMNETIFEVRNEDGKRIESGEGILYIGSNSRLCLIDDEDISLLNTKIFRNTGDVVEIRPAGQIILKGRQDRQIKIYGMELDMDYLECCVNQLSFVEDSRALFDVHNQSLHLYFTTYIHSPTEDQIINMKRKIADFVSTLPVIYHVEKISLLSQFKLTPHGKICDNFLKNCSVELPGLSDNSKKGLNAGELFHDIWKNFLPFDRDSGFLDLGGSSLSALRIADELAQKSGRTFPQLIGHLLRNENFNTCRAYVERQITNLSSRANDETNMEQSSTSTIDESHELLDPKKSSELVDESEKEQKRIVNSQKSEIIIPWQKCRGRSNFPLSIETDTQIAWNKYTKICMHKSYFLNKCVDASPTIFCYPGGENYVTVGSHAGLIYTVELPKTFKNWRVQLPDRIEASIVVVNDFRGIVGTYDGFLYCIHLKTGEIFWKFKTGDTVKCTVALCSRKQNVFFGSYDRKAYCVSLENGSQVWRVKAGNGSISATPCIHDELDSVIFASLDGTCASLNQESGEINWIKKLDYPIFSGPVILDDGICVFCDVSGRLDGIFVATGEKAWQIKIDGNIFSHLLVHTDPNTKLQSLIFGSENKHVYKFDCRYEMIRPICRFTKNVGVSVISTPSSDGRVIVVAGIDGTLKISNFINAEEITNFRLDGEVFSSPLIHDNFIVVGSRDNYLNVLCIYDEKPLEKILS